LNNPFYNAVHGAPLAVPFAFAEKQALFVRIKAKNGCFFTEHTI